MNRSDDRDLLDDALRSRLYDVEITPSPFDWERLESRVVPTRRVISWKWYATAIAAAATIALFVLVPYSNKKTESVDLLSETPLVTSPKVVHSIPEPIVIKSNIPLKNSTLSMSKSIVMQPSIESIRESVLSEKTDSPSPIIAEVELTNSSVAPDSPVTCSEKSNAIHPLDRMAIEERVSKQAVSYDQNGKSGGTWSLGAHGGNNGGLSTTETMPRMSTGALMSGGMYEIDQTNTFRSKVNPISLHHDVPLSFGLSVRKMVHPRWAIESGLIYTYMRSQGRMGGIMPYTIRQYLHYIGVPVSVNYTILKYKRFNLYTAVGGTVERCVSALRTTMFDDNKLSKSPISNNLSVNDFDFSLHAKVGAAFDFTDHVGMYLEPMANYYFSDNEKVESYRKETPFGVSFRLGLFVKF